MPSACSTDCTGNSPPVSPESLAAFASLKDVHAGVLSVRYADAGPTGGPAVLLLHGWPYDIHSFVEVSPLLAAAGFRVVVPYLRGFGGTRLSSSATVRNGQQSVLAYDVIELMDALKIQKAILAGFDWGARTANIVAALWPERCNALVSVSGYLIGNQEAGKAPLAPRDEYQWWYQYYFATERGRTGYDKYRRDFAKFIWQQASPKWNFNESTFQRSAAAFDNEDHVSIVTGIDWNSDRRSLIFLWLLLEFVDPFYGDFAAWALAQSAPGLSRSGYCSSIPS